MEPLQTWWTTELYPTSDEDNFGVVGNFEVVKAADAQATIAALEQRVKELKQWVQDQSTANLETMRHTDEMQSRALEAEQQLTQRTAELERVRGERDEYAHKTKMLCLQNGPLMIENHDMKKLIAALPKVEAVPMTDAGWTRERPTAAGWYWNRISGTAGIALITRRDGRLYVWLKFKDAWLTREGWLDYIHGEWLGPITPDSYARGGWRDLT
jgi:hypothetical protein